MRIITLILIICFFACSAFAEDCSETEPEYTPSEKKRLDNISERESEISNRLQKLKTQDLMSYNQYLQDVNAERVKLGSEKDKILDEGEKRLTASNKECKENREALAKKRKEREKLAKQRKSDGKVQLGDATRGLETQTRDPDFATGPAKSYGSNPSPSAPSPSASPAPSYSNPTGNTMPTQAMLPSYQQPVYSNEPTSFDSVFNQASGGETQYQQDPQDEFVPRENTRGGPAPEIAERSENPYDEITYDTRNSRGSTDNTVVGDEFVDPATVGARRGNTQLPNYQNPHANPFIGRQVAHYQHPTGRADEPNDLNANGRVGLGTENPSKNLRTGQWRPFAGTNNGPSAKARGGGPGQQRAGGTSPEDMKPENVALKPTAEQEREKQIAEDELKQLPKVELQEDEGGGGSKGFFANLTKKVTDFFSSEKGEKSSSSNQNNNDDEFERPVRSKIAKASPSSEPTEPAEQHAEKSEAHQKQANAGGNIAEEKEEKGFFEKIFDISSWFGSDEEADGDEQYEDTAAYVEKDPVFDDELSKEEIARAQEEELKSKSIRELAEAQSRAGDKLPALDGPAEETPHLENNYGVYGLDN